MEIISFYLEKGSLQSKFKEDKRMFHLCYPTGMNMVNNGTSKFPTSFTCPMGITDTQLYDVMCVEEKKLSLDVK